MNSIVRLIAYAFLVLPSLVVMPAIQETIGGNDSFILSVIFYVFILFIVVLVHELAHAITALAVGWRITLFAVFPLAYRPQTGTLKFWTSPSGDLGGMVEFSRDGRKTNARALFVALAGPLANFLLASVAIGIAYLIPGEQKMMGYIAGTSLFTGLGNLLPWKSRNGIKSDGATAVSLMRRMVNV